MGAASVAKATVVVMPHLVEFLYSYGLSTSGMIDSRAKRPLLSDVGTMVTAFDLVDEARVAVRPAATPGSASAPGGSPEVLTEGTAACTGKPFSTSRAVSVSVLSIETIDARRSTSSG
jgi:hypothetical protein